MRSLIVGGGVAGITAALDLSRRNLGEVDVYSDEAYPYYYRPQLTEFIAGEITLDKLFRRKLGWYEERGIHIHLSSPVTALDTQNKIITIAGNNVVPYDKLLLSMGSKPSLPPIAGGDKQGIFTWRTLNDSLEIEKSAVTCSQTVVIGGGLLGLEAARGLLGFCPHVTILEFFPRLLPRQLDVEGAALLQHFVESLGIRVIVDAKTEAFLGDEHVTGVRTKDGREFPAWTVLIAAGVRPEMRLAQEAGIQVDRGVVVDEHMATNVPDVFAAGDVAAYKGYSWAIAPIAQVQARIASANMAGEVTAYDVIVPSTTLKVVGIDVSSIGVVNPEENTYQEIRKLDQNAGTYKKIVLHDGAIVGSIIINDKALAKELEKRIAGRAAMNATEAQSLLG
ncbi:MAG: NAD(P)/FAD-dependent oxidoreductase [Anaerolineae bacterium]|nr:NAD(P)/FAD-dependent oxidoreductase [Anaerolineae bacterium]